MRFARQEDLNDELGSAQEKVRKLWRLVFALCACLLVAIGFLGARALSPAEVRFVGLGANESLIDLESWEADGAQVTRAVLKGWVRSVLEIPGDRRILKRNLDEAAEMLAAAEAGTARVRMRAFLREENPFERFGEGWQREVVDLRINLIGESEGLTSAVVTENYSVFASMRSIDPMGVEEEEDLTMTITVGLNAEKSFGREIRAVSFDS